MKEYVRTAERSCHGIIQATDADSVRKSIKSLKVKDSIMALEALREDQTLEIIEVEERTSKNN